MRADATRAGARSNIPAQLPTAKNPHVFYFTGNAVKKQNHMHDRDHVGTLMRDDANNQPDQNDGKLASVSYSCLWLRYCWVVPFFWLWFDITSILIVLSV